MTYEITERSSSMKGITKKSAQFDRGNFETFYIETLKYMEGLLEKLTNSLYALFKCFFGLFLLL